MTFDINLHVVVGDGGGLLVSHIQTHTHMHVHILSNT